jgi:hypothetical protein
VVQELQIGGTSLATTGTRFSTRVSMSYLGQICQWFQAPSGSPVSATGTIPVL